MRRILFVDDETNVLRGLQRMLRRMKDEWQMEFAESGAAALEAIEREPFDIVVSDMKMPGMDGAELLSEVKRLQPETVRIILSGHSEKEAILKCIGSTHQYLSKPCDPKLLKQTIQRAEALRTLLRNESIRRLISQMSSLPSLPALFQQVIAELQKPNVSLKTVGAVIEQDIGMSAKILQIVNSSYFGLRIPITNVGRAVTHLGLETINSLVLGVSVFSQYEGQSVPNFSIDSLWNHSMRTAAFAKAVAQAEKSDKKAADDAYTAGMLHDAGKLVLAAHSPERYGQVLERVTREKLAVSDAEKDLLGATHAEAGAYVVGLWGLPDSMVEAIAYHARPNECPVAEFGVLTIVHVASGLAQELGSAGDTTPAHTIDLDYLTHLGLASRLPVWRDVCCEALLEEEVHQ